MTQATPVTPHFPMPKPTIGAFPARTVADVADLSYAKGTPARLHTPDGYERAVGDLVSIDRDGEDWLVVLDTARGRKEYVCAADDRLSPTYAILQ